jgi:hypothetical protein
LQAVGQVALVLEVLEVLEVIATLLAVKQQAAVEVTKRL